MRTVLSAAMCGLALALSPAPAAALERCVAIDGDTLICHGERIRLLAVDTPELRARCDREAELATEAKRLLQRLVAGGVKVHRLGKETVTYRAPRTLAHVEDADGHDIGRMLLADPRRLAVPYDGGRARMDWCKR